jgi:HD-like signal output (HDOD) protein
MIDREVMRKLLQVRDLPTLPEVMGEILDTVGDENSTAADLTAILERDHAISARVLRMANSAFYGLRHKVDSIRHAVIVIGFDAVRLLALATSVFDALTHRSQFTLDPKDFWMHSLGAAKAAQLVSERCGWLGSGHTCFTLGLLHDIGKYILALAFKEDYHRVFEMAMRSERSLQEVEAEQLQTTHAEVGEWIAERWLFPPMMINVIGNLYKASVYSGPHKREVIAVALANDMSCAGNYGSAGDPMGQPVDENLASLLSLTPDDIVCVMQDLEESREETLQFINVLEQKATV